MFLKKQIIALLLFLVLIGSTGIAQYGQTGGGYGQGQGQQGYNQQPYNQPNPYNQPLQPQNTGGYGYQQPQQNIQGPGTSGFSPMMSGFQLGFEQGIAGVDPAKYAENLMLLGLLKQLALRRTELNLATKCLETGGAEQISNALVDSYNQSGKTLIQMIYEKRKATVESQCNSDYCSQGFNFLQGAPPEVRGIIKENNLKIDAASSPAEIENTIQKICELSMEKEINSQKTRLEKEAEKQASRFEQECERAKQQQAQQQQWEQQRQQQMQNQGPNSWGPQGQQGMGQPGQGGQQGPQCPQGQYWNGSGCVQGGGQPQGYCGDGMCNEAPETCINDCGPQGGGGPQPPPNCGADQYWDGQSCVPSGGGGGTGAPPDSGGGGDSGSPPGDGEGGAPPADGGGLAGNVFNQLFGKGLFSFTAFVNLLQFQESETDEGTVPPATDTGTPSQENPQCPPGEYWGTNDLGIQSCIAGGGGGYGPPSQPTGYNQPNSTMPQGNGYGYGPGQGGGYNAPGPGGPGMMPPQGFGGGPGFGQYSFDEMCESGNIKEKIAEEMMGQFDGMQEEMKSRCPIEAKQRAVELNMVTEQFLVNAETCSVRAAENCSQGQAVIAAFEEAMRNVPEAAKKIVDYRCSVIQLQAANAQKDRFSEIALGLDELTQQSALSQDGTIASSATSMDVLETKKALEQSQQEAGVLSLILPDQKIQEAYQKSAENLADNQKTIEDLKKQNLSADQKTKLEEIEKKLKEETNRANNCKNVGYFRFLSGC